MEAEDRSRGGDADFMASQEGAWIQQPNPVLVDDSGIASPAAVSNNQVFNYTQKYYKNKHFTIK